MGINSIRGRAKDGEILAGTWLVLGSALTAEIAGNSGFDWVVLDMEHGMGGNDSLLMQLQALSGTPASPIVRVAKNDPVLIKRALDLGPAGIMAPHDQHRPRMPGRWSGRCVIHPRGSAA